MSIFTKNLISVSYSVFRFCLIKLTKWGRFKFQLVERFSPNTQLCFIGKNSKIILNKAVRAHSRVKLRAINDGIIKIGQNVSLNYGCIIVAMHNISIGEGTEFGPNVLVYDHDHDFRAKGGLKANKYSKGKVTIGNNCWVGANTVILKGTSIGDNSVIAAGSVIKGDYPANSIIYQQRETKVKTININ